MPEEPTQLTRAMLDDIYSQLIREPDTTIDGCYWLEIGPFTQAVLLQRGRFRKRSMSNRSRRKFRNMKRYRK